jgi:hypothetical protein
VLGLWLLDLGIPFKHFLCQIIWELFSTASIAKAAFRNMGEFIVLDIVRSQEVQIC